MAISISLPVAGAELLQILRTVRKELGPQRVANFGKDDVDVFILFVCGVVEFFAGVFDIFGG